MFSLPGSVFVGLSGVLTVCLASIGILMLAASNSTLLGIWHSFESSNVREEGCLTTVVVFNFKL